MLDKYTQVPTTRQIHAKISRDLYLRLKAENLFLGDFDTFVEDALQEKIDSHYRKQIKSENNSGE